MKTPVKKFSAGSVSCALWENEMQLPNGGTKDVLKATFERRYKDKNGEWKSSNSYGRNELALLRYCVDKAFEAMLEERSWNSVEEEIVR